MEPRTSVNSDYYYSSRVTACDSPMTRQTLISLDGITPCWLRALTRRFVYTRGEVTSQSLWSRYDRRFVGITRHNALR